MLLMGEVIGVYGGGDGVIGSDGDEAGVRQRR